MADDKNSGPMIHYVATFEEAQKLVDSHDRFWVSNCGCREGGPGCKRSRTDLCLFFDEVTSGSGSGLKAVDRQFVDEILKETKEKHLVSRPFRDDQDLTRTQGICFCCDDCCGYFQGTVQGTEYTCDKGTLVEQTDLDACTHCGDCIPLCYFQARKMTDGKLEIISDNCAGCGMCRDGCPVDCIAMVGRGILKSG